MQFSPPPDEGWSPVYSAGFNLPAVMAQRVDFSTALTACVTETFVGILLYLCHSLLPLSKRE